MRVGKMMKNSNQDKRREKRLRCDGIIGGRFEDEPTRVRVEEWRDAWVVLINEQIDSMHEYKRWAVYRAEKLRQANRVGQ